MATPKAPEPQGFRPIEVTFTPDEGWKPIEVTPPAAPTPEAAPVAATPEPTTGKKEI